MNCRQALDHARKSLQNSRIDDYALEGEILVRYVTGLDRTQLFANLDKELTTGQIEQLSKLIQRRQSGEPSAYITGHKEFFGLDFKVNQSVLIPRPETELLLEKAIEFARRYKYSSIADIGTGSGCIAVSLAIVREKADIWAIDSSTEALETARNNVEHYGLYSRIHLLQGNLLEPLIEPVDMIIANLPYVKTDEINLPYEPRAALDGGEDGLDKIRELMTQAPAKLKPKGAVLLEVGLGHADDVKALLLKVFPGNTVEVVKDLAGIDRVLTMRLTA